ncbi:protein EFR3 homolog B-like isoform X3 [Varroa jacobsoni]|uniref:Uncharacterized protein n=1 Tax=Varroa destructor TaxID=109461 RepID=A0A7M7J2C5_VARDE|nr:protein EFR3 homolog B-like isoform X3 [Varroa destructor]XP_022710754.1 protein EFR3 homolog B-like isoform X3 [Varroa jacobsoni]
MCPGCCGCCSALKPRYKRLVDSIYPINPEDSLVKISMEKLTFYAVSSPEKLDRIGEYIAYRVQRDIHRGRDQNVEMSMEAMDSLLVACHSQSLNLFVESFLKIVQLLLESQNPELQLLATRSFVKFANIEEDTPSYHRRYDFFVCKFASLAHCTHSDTQMMTRLRMAGVEGLQGVIRKTVSDELQVNIWEDLHMGKIVPSLLFNMAEKLPSAGDSDEQGPTSRLLRQGGIDLSSPSVLDGLGCQDDSKQTPESLAITCFRELMSRATYGHINSVIKPVLTHLDKHQLWAANDNTFAVHVFKIIMYSIQAQYSYAVIQLLMAHLDNKYSSQSRTFHLERTGIVKVLYHIVNIAASESVGPSVLDIFHSLLNHLRRSIQLDNEEMEANFQEAVIETLGEFANNLPDYQKTEIMLFILSKVPHRPEGDTAASPTEGELQRTMLRSLLTVATKYSTVNLNQALPVSFLQSILRMSLAPDLNVRIIVQKILQTLLDRHDNLTKLEQVGFVPCTGDPLPTLSVEKCSRQDAVFMRKLGPEILYHMYAGILLRSNTYDNFVSIYITMALIVIELGSEELLTEVLRIMFALQEEMQKEPTENSVYVHRFIASYLYLASSLTSIPAMLTHVNEVISARVDECPWLLPGPAPTSHPNSPGSLQLADKYLFNMKSIGEALHSSGHDTSKLFQPYTAPAALPSGVSAQRSIMVNLQSATFTSAAPKAATDGAQNSASFDLGSVDSSPGTVKKFVDLEDVSVKAFKAMLGRTTTAGAEQRRAEVVNIFKTTPFKQLCQDMNRSSAKNLQGALTEILAMVPLDSVEIPSKVEAEMVLPSFQTTFPDLFVY